MLGVKQTNKRRSKDAIDTFRSFDLTLQRACRSMQVFTPGHGEMVRLVMGSAHHEADKPETANMGELRGSVGDDRQSDTVGKYLGIGAPIRQPVELTRVRPRR